MGSNFSPAQKLPADASPANTLTLSVTFGPFGFASSSANAKLCTSRNRTAPQISMMYRPVLEHNFRLNFLISTVKVIVSSNRNHEPYNMAH